MQFIKYIQGALKTIYLIQSVKKIEEGLYPLLQLRGEGGGSERRGGDFRGKK